MAYLPSKRLAKQSLMVQCGLQNGTEQKSPEILLFIAFPFENEGFLTFDNGTNESRDPETHET